MKIKYKKYILLIKKDNRKQKPIFISFLYMIILTSCLENKSIKEKKIDVIEQKPQKEINNNPQSHNKPYSKSITDSHSNPDPNSDSDSNPDPNSDPDSNPDPDFDFDSNANSDSDSDRTKEQVMETIKKNISEIRKLRKQYSTETNKEKAAIIYRNADLLANEIFELVSKLENPSPETYNVLDESAQELNNFRGPKKL